MLIKGLKLKQKQRGKHIKLFKVFSSQKLLSGFLVWIQRGKTEDFDVLHCLLKERERDPPIGRSWHEALFDTASTM